MLIFPKCIFLAQTTPLESKFTHSIADLTFPTGNLIGIWTFTSPEMNSWFSSSLLNKQGSKPFLFPNLLHLSIWKVHPSNFSGQRVVWFFFFSSSVWQFLLILPSKYMQSTPHHCYCQHSELSHNHLSPTRIIEIVS